MTVISGPRAGNETVTVCIGVIEVTAVTRVIQTRGVGINGRAGSVGGGVAGTVLVVDENVGVRLVVDVVEVSEAGVFGVA